ncbi:hypothetical protein H8959_012437 [Pygathrix nigripes]
MMYQLVVHGVMGKSTVLDVASSEEEFNNMTVKWLMKLVSKAVLKADTMDFLLMFANYRLDPEKKLQDYQIRNKSTVIIVVQLPGGGPGHQGCADPVLGGHLVVEPHWSWVGSAGY